MASQAVQRCLLGLLQRLVAVPLRACFQQVVQLCFLGKVVQRFHVFVPPVVPCVTPLQALRLHENIEPPSTVVLWLHEHLGAPAEPFAWTMIQVLQSHENFELLSNLFVWMHEKLAMGKVLQRWAPHDAGQSLSSSTP